MKVYVYFVFGLISISNMCFQSNRGTRGGLIRRIPRWITTRAQPTFIHNNISKGTRNLIEVTSNTGNIIEGNDTEVLQSKQKHESADLNSRTADERNLIYVDCNDHIANKDNFSIALVNCQSIKNKTDHISDIIVITKF